MDKLHNLELYKKIDTTEMFIKLTEETYEVRNELVEFDNMINKEKLASEILDVMQCCMGIAFTQNIDLKDYIEKHNKKLLGRGHKFIK